jgi:hypothetical protein
MAVTPDRQKSVPSLSSRALTPSHLSRPHRARSQDHDLRVAGALRELATMGIVAHVERDVAK